MGDTVSSSQQEIMLSNNNNLQMIWKIFGQKPGSKNLTFHETRLHSKKIRNCEFRRSLKFLLNLKFSGFQSWFQFSRRSTSAQTILQKIRPIFPHRVPADYQVPFSIATDIFAPFSLDKSNVKMIPVTCNVSFPLFCSSSL